jgi:hypothetical protein
VNQKTRGKNPLKTRKKTVVFFQKHEVKKHGRRLL